MTHTQGKSQRPVDFEDRVETDGRTYTTDRSTFPANAASNYSAGNTMLARIARYSS